MKLVALGLGASPAERDDRRIFLRAMLPALAARDHDTLALDCGWPSPFVRGGACRLGHYADLASLDRWRSEIASADAVIVGSGLRDGAAVGRYVHRLASGIAAFVDLDTPATLARVEAGNCDYLTAEMIAGYDLYLASVGGPTLDRLERVYGSPVARSLAIDEPNNGDAVIALEAYLYEAGVSAALSLCRAGRGGTASRILLPAP